MARHATRGRADPITVCGGGEMEFSTFWTRPTSTELAVWGIASQCKCIATYCQGIATWCWNGGIKDVFILNFSRTIALT